MKRVELNSVRQQMESLDTRYVEFIRSSSLSVGVYSLSAGETDQQQPHHEDEVYYVVEGRAKMEVGSEQVPALPGSVIYIPALEGHRFVDIESDLTVLVFFAPPESLPGSSAPTENS